MTSKQRVRAAIEHRQPDRVAIDFFARDEIVAGLRRHWGLKPDEPVEERLGVDLRFVGPALKLNTYPHAYADPSIEVRPAGLYRDIWGVGFRRNQTAHGQYMDLADYPLRQVESVDELARHSWPSPDWWDYSGIAAAARANGQYWVWAHSRGIFEISWFLRGFDNFLYDLAARPALAGAVMDRVQAYLFERTRRILQAGDGRLDMIEYNDDVGGQNGLLISPEMWRANLKPRFAAFVQLCRPFGVKIRYHCCGGIRPIIPDLIEIGVDVLNPVQALAEGMDGPGLKRDFGRCLTFNGGVDTQAFLPRATADEVRERVGCLIEVMNADGGFILAPAHVFQGDVPLENVLAVYEAALDRRL